MVKLLEVSLLCILGLPWTLQACDPTACHIGTSAGLATGCAAVGAALTTASCAATLGIGCVVGCVVTTGPCAVATAGPSYGIHCSIDHYH